MLSLTLRQIEYVTAIARHCGMTAAAAALHVSQPSLSVALREVERTLARPLFLRRPGGRMVPTAFGRLWLDAAEAQLAAVARLAQGRIDPPLRLAVFLDLAPLILAPLMAATGAGIDPQVMDFEPLVHGLTRGRIDAAVTWDLGLDAQIARRVLARIAPHVVLAPDHPLAARQGLRLADLTDQPLVLTDQGPSIAHVRALFARAGLAPRIAHRTATLDLMRSYAANGLGIGLSWSRPHGRISPDGRRLALRPLTDAGTEAVVLAFPEAAEPAGIAELAARLRPLLQPDEAAEMLPAKPQGESP
ncbi:MAG: LysR family transcriptional regulator [Paracoccaceae bacterium]